MFVLHIASLSTDMANGVNVVVPNHVEEQSKYIEARLLNIRNIEVSDLQIKYGGG